MADGYSFYRLYGDTVSYTHLDVYKRQTGHFTESRSSIHLPGPGVSLLLVIACNNIPFQICFTETHIVDDKLFEKLL